MQAMLRSHGVHNVRRWLAVDGRKLGLRRDGQTTFMPRPLTPGELGLRQSIVSLLRHAQEQDFLQVMVLDDDVLLDCDFETRLAELLRDERCSGYMWTAKQGGVLLLGSTMWLKGFSLVDQERKAVRKLQGSEPQCFNHVYGNLGSFAWIAHRAAFQSIIDFVEQSSDPFDWVWNDLASAGFIVRAAYPALAIADITHASTVNDQRDKDSEAHSDIAKRYKRHRWDRRAYCAS
jgi:GR25 family glycosyltransferase involved in LPS biosynthesis